MTTPEEDRALVDQALARWTDAVTIRDYIDQLEARNAELERVLANLHAATVDPDDGTEDN